MPSEVDSTPSAHVNPNIYQLENKPKHVLCHEIGAGSPCLRCGCPGLDLHYWRKMCKICSCRMDDHDVILPANMDHGQIVIGRLFDFIPEFENKLHIYPPMVSADGVQLRHRDTTEDGGNMKARPVSQYNVKLDDYSEREKGVEYTWVPTVDRVLTEKYFNALPPKERPIAGTEGALDRRHKLQYQLPNHDSDASAAKSLLTEADRKEHAKYVTAVKEKVVGVGKLIEFNEANQQTSHTKTTSAMNSGDARDDVVDYGKCYACGKKMTPGEVAIVTDHGAPDELWHVHCFRCHTCDQRLVDLLYFYKDGFYYCGRHFGDSVYPRCAGCDELIFSKEYTFAEDKSWHLDHFCCFGCDLPLGGHRYMMKNDQPYCFTCYMEKFAKTCLSCGNKIAPDQQRISFHDLHWHASDQCFWCKNCEHVMLNQRFVVKNKDVFCSSDCRKKYQKAAANSTNENPGSFM